MCHGYKHKDISGPLPKEYVMLSNTDIMAIRDFLDEELFYFPPNHPKCNLLRKIQRDTIHELGRALNLE
jgi:hypothetical protein